MFNVKISSFVAGENGLKLKIKETFTTASRIKWLGILQISEINWK